MLLHNIRIILVRTFHAGNIGSAARSIKTMGLDNLVLVNPRDYPSPESIKMAAGANDILDKTTIVSDLKEAVHDCTTVIASTARPRGYDLPALNPQQCAEMLVHHSANATVALMFGPERMGLHNKDIQCAKYRVTIPANPEYSSLNLASAVQILAYEIFKASTGLNPHQHLSALQKRHLPSTADIEYLHKHLEQVLKDIHFLRPHQGETLQRIKQLFDRAEIDQLELNIVRGILCAIQKQMK